MYNIVLSISRISFEHKSISMKNGFVGFVKNIVWLIDGHNFFWRAQKAKSIMHQKDLFEECLLYLVCPIFQSAFDVLFSHVFTRWEPLIDHLSKKCYLVSPYITINRGLLGEAGQFLINVELRAPTQIRRYWKWLES